MRVGIASDHGGFALKEQIAVLASRQEGIDLALLTGRCQYC